MHIVCDTLKVAVFCELVAQSVEQRTFNAWVVGSNPTELTTKFPTQNFSHRPGLT